MKKISEISLAEAKKEYARCNAEGYYESLHSQIFQQLVLNSIGEKSVNETAKLLFLENGGSPVFDNVKCESYRKNLSNWKNGSNFPPFVKNLNRKNYIDTLLYLRIHNGQANPLKYFNSQLSKLGLAELYILDYYDFCVATAILLEYKTKENCYMIFRKLYNDSQLKKLSEKQGKAPNYDFTCYYLDDFYSIEEIGRLENADCSNEYYTKTAYQFIDRYVDDFGRSRLSSYFAFGALLCGYSLYDIVDTISKELFNKKLYVKEEGESKAYGFEEAVLNQLESDDARKNIFLISQELCVAYLKYMHARWYNEDMQADMEIRRGSGEKNYEYMSLEEIEKELESIKQALANTSSRNILKASDSDVAKMLSNTKSLTRGALLLTIITSMSNNSIRVHIDRNSTQKSIASRKLIDAINNVLEGCSMAKLDESISKYDFLLLSAIYNVSYADIYKSKETNYPFRDIVFYEILGEEAEKSIEEMEKELSNE